MALCWVYHLFMKLLPLHGLEHFEALTIKNASTAIKTEFVLKISINVISFTFDYYHGNFFQEKDNNYNELNANLTDITLSLPCSKAHDYKL
jgi:hypothetical protein